MQHQSADNDQMNNLDSDLNRFFSATENIHIDSPKLCFFLSWLARLPSSLPPLHPLLLVVNPLSSQACVIDSSRADCL